MKIIVKHQPGAGFLAETASGHPIHMDASEEAGGRNLGARPMEVVLAGAGGLQHRRRDDDPEKIPAGSA